MYCAIRLHTTVQYQLSNGGEKKRDVMTALLFGRCCKYKLELERLISIPILCTFSSLVKDTLYNAVFHTHSSASSLSMMRVQKWLVHPTITSRHALRRVYGLIQS